MRKLLTILILLILYPLVGIRAQQRPQYTQYMINPLLINPAVTGSVDRHDVKMGSRLQWLGFEGAPQTYYSTYHTPFRQMPFKMSGINKGHHGAGLKLIGDVAGPISQMAAYGTYAYHHPIAENVFASVGAELGVLQYNIDLMRLNLTDPNDPRLVTLLNSRVVPDASVGVWVYGDRFFAGASALQLFRETPFFIPNDQEYSLAELNVHYFFTAGYKIAVPESDWFFVPSVMYKVVKPLYANVDVNIKVQKSKNVWFGASFRQDDSIGLLFGMAKEIPNFENLFGFTYSFDFVYSDIGPYSGGSHEITIWFQFKRRGKKVMCPDDFWN